MTTKKWMEAAVLYKRFAEKDSRLDWSDSAAEDMFRYESVGGNPPKSDNGYYHGKLSMDRTIEMWKEGMIEGTIFPFELFDEYDEAFIKKHIHPDILMAAAQKYSEIALVGTKYEKYVLGR